MQVNKLEKQLTHCKEEQESEIRVIQAEAERIKGEVAGLKDANSHSVAHSASRVRALQVCYASKTAVLRAWNKS